jgi:hypothetical protein
VLPNLPQDGKKIIGYREAMTLPKLPKSMVLLVQAQLVLSSPIFMQRWELK